MGTSLDIMKKMRSVTNLTGAISTDSKMTATKVVQMTLMNMKKNEMPARKSLVLKKVTVLLFLIIASLF